MRSRGQGGQFRASAAEAQLAGEVSTLKQLKAQKVYRERASTELKDVMVDEKTGAGFYNAEFEVPASELAKIREVRGANFSLRAGAPVQVVMPVRKRTALEYAFEPLSRIAAIRP